MINYVAFGIIIDDLVLPDGTVIEGILGGGGPQTAWGMAAALGSGEQVGLVAGVGDDLPPGILDPLRAAGINLDGVRQTASPTPRAYQHLDANGSRRQTWRTPVSILGEQLRRDWDALPASYRDAHYFHWGIHPDSAQLEFAADLTQKGRIVSLETFRPPAQPLSEDELRAIVGACTVFSPNLEEARAMTGANRPDTVIKLAFFDAGCQILALRLGDRGGLVLSEKGEHSVFVSAYPTQVIDPVGAGNAFCGAFLARFSDGIAEAAYHTAVAASYMVEQIGIPARLPDPADYRMRVAFVRKQSEAGGKT